MATQADEERGPENRRTYLAHVMTSQAGPIAEKICNNHYSLVSDISDVEMIREFVERLRFNDHQVKRVYRLTWEMVYRHRETIERVAAELKKRRTLSGREIDKLMTGIKRSRSRPTPA